MELHAILTKGLVTSPATDYVALVERNGKIDVYLKDKKTDAVRATILQPIDKADALDYVPFGYNVEIR
jgi:hypothetical protein